MSTPEIKNSDFVFEDRRGRPKAENPYVEAVRASWADAPADTKLGSAKEVVLKNDTEITKQGKPKNVVTAMGQIRDAAAQLGLGVRLEIVPATKVGKKVLSLGPDENGSGTHTVIYFAAKERTKRPRKDETSAE